MRPDPLKQEMRAINRAGYLARTGEFENWQAVQEALLAEGFENARQALKSDVLRQLLDRDCTRSK